MPLVPMPMVGESVLQIPHQIGPTTKPRVSLHTSHPILRGWLASCNLNDKDGSRLEIIKKTTISFLMYTYFIIKKRYDIRNIVVAYESLW